MISAGVAPYCFSAYETVILFLSDPTHSKHPTGEESQNITAELERLRDRLDELIRKFGK
jgi:hypothetical protein